MRTLDLPVRTRRLIAHLSTSDRESGRFRRNRGPNKRNRSSPTGAEITKWHREGTNGPEVTKMRLCDVPRSFGTNTGPSVGQKTDQVLDHRHIAKTRIWLCSAVSFGPVGRQGDTPDIL